MQSIAPSLPVEITEGMQALKNVWIHSLLTTGDKPNWGLLRGLDQDGVPGDMFQVVICNWHEFQTFCGIRNETRRPELNRIKAFSFRVKEFCAAIQEHKEKVPDELADQL
jgi:hypothetical protein